MGIVLDKDADQVAHEAHRITLDHTGEVLVLPDRYLRPMATMKSSILANELLLPWDMDSPAWRLRAYTTDRWVAAHLIETSLLYDRIVVPTVDLSIVVPLIHWLGVPVFREMVMSDSLSFIRYRGNIGYGGNGLGIVLHQIRAPDSPYNWWVQAAYVSPSEAAGMQIRHRLRGFREDVSDALASIVGLSTVDTSLPQFQSRVANETYRDIAGSNVLVEHFQPECTDLARMAGVAPNEMRTYMYKRRLEDAGDGIDIAIRIAMANLEVYLAEEAGTRDMATVSGFETILKAKAARYTGSSDKAESFATVLRMESLPDLETAVVAGELDLARLWDFRNTKTAAQFRRWFDEVGPASPHQVMVEYTKCLRSPGGLTTTRAKLIRFIVLQLIGAALVPATSGASLLATGSLSAVDCFLLDKIRVGFNPRYFVDDLRHAVLQSPRTAGQPHPHPSTPGHADRTRHNPPAQ